MIVNEFNKNQKFIFIFFLLTGVMIKSDLLSVATGYLPRNSFPCSTAFQFRTFLIWEQKKHSVLTKLIDLGPILVLRSPVCGVPYHRVQNIRLGGNDRMPMSST